MAKQLDIADSSAVPASMGSLAPLDPERENALDALLKASGDGAEETEPEKEEPKAEDAKPDKAEAKSEEVAVAPEQAAEEAKPEAKEAKSEVKPEAKEAKPEPKAEDTKPEKDELDSVALPPYTKPSTAESFAKVKELARQKLREREARITELEEKAKQLDEEVKTRPAKETVAELEELRQWRKRIDVEHAPEWKDYDKKVEQKWEGVYAKLKASGITDAQVKQIKDLGGPEKVDWEPFYQAGLPSATRRYLESQMTAVENLREEREHAIAAAREGADEFLSARGKQAAQVAEALIGGFEWAKEQPVPATATAEQKAQIAAANAFAKETQARVRSAVADDTPQTRAELAVGTALAYYFKRQAEQVSATAQKTKEEADKRVAEAEKKAAQLSEELERVRKSSGSRKQTSPSPAAPPAKVDMFAPGVEALDALRNQMQG